MKITFPRVVSQENITAIRHDRAFLIRTSRVFMLLLAVSAFAEGPPDSSPRHGPRNGLDAVRRWNRIAVDASGLDHTPPAPGENRVFGEQLGPCRASRAMAIVHIAMFHTVNAVVGEYTSYTAARAPFAPLPL